MKDKCEMSHCVECYHHMSSCISQQVSCSVAIDQGPFSVILDKKNDHNADVYRNDYAKDCVRRAI